MNIPKISVISVCRNVGEEILHTIESICSQTYDNIELIVVDGASTDNTVDYIHASEKNISKWISEPDRGIYDAMNKGLRMATGEWVSFINVGDSFADDDVILDIFGKDEIPNEVKLIGGNTCNYFPDGHVEMHYAEAPNVIPYRLPFSHQACFARRELVNEQGTFQFDSKYRYAADYNFIYDVYHKYGADAIKIVNRIIANYKQEGSTSIINYRSAKKEYLKIQSAYPNKMWLKEVVKYILRKY